MCDLCEQAPPGDNAHPFPPRTSGVVRALVCNVAFWQGMGFLMLICLVWVNETLGLTNFFLGRRPDPEDWVGAALLTAGILVIAFVTVAHTYVLQRRILEGIIIVCSYCSKVKIEETSWERMEHFLAGRTRARFSHGICPHCYHELQQEMGEGEARPMLSPPSRPPSSPAGVDVPVQADLAG